MSPGDEERRVGIYFGPSPYTSLTKEEVGEFIKNRMGLIRSDDGPKWTEGLTTLIKYGMKAWEDGIDRGAQLGEEIKELSNKLDEYHHDMEELVEIAQQQQSEGDLISSAKRVHRTEARILEVLSRDTHLGVKSPNYVSWETLTKETGLDRDVIIYYAQMLAEPNAGGFVELDRLEANVKLLDEGMFEEYCDCQNVDSDEIVKINEIKSGG